MAKIAFLGLGVMGYPMAGHIAAAGHEVTVYNRTAPRPRPGSPNMAGNGGAHAATPAAAATDADVVLSCVGDDPDVLEVALGADGAIPAMRAGAIYIDNSTVSAEVARKLAAAGAERGVGVLDAPVSGGQAGAENGKLTVMVGGAEDHFAAALPVMECYGARVVRMGEAGSGQLAKMVNQICIAGLVQGLSEGLNFAVESGLDTDALLEAISGGAAQSWQMVNRGHTMVRNEFDFGFAVDWMRKDLRICREEAARNGAPLPVTEIVAGFYDELSEMGHGRGDTSSLIRCARGELPINRLANLATGIAQMEHGLIGSCRGEFCGTTFQCGAPLQSVLSLHGHRDCRDSIIEQLTIVKYLGMIVGNCSGAAKREYPGRPWARRMDQSESIGDGASDHCRSGLFYLPALIYLVVIFPCVGVWFWFGRSAETPDGTPGNGRSPCCWRSAC